MSQVTVKRLDGTAFVGRGESNHWVAMDTKKAVGGMEAASSPMELVLLALGGCTSMDVIPILEKMKVPVENYELGIDYERSAEHPKVFTKIWLNFRFWGKDLPLDRLKRAVALSEEKYCSVSAMLKKSVEIEARIENNNTA